MLLECDIGEILRLVSSGDHLRARTKEGFEVLTLHGMNQGMVLEDG